MAELPHCSIVVPTYDRPAALRSCLESLAGLEYARERYEVIVVDDGGRLTLDPVVDLLRPRMNLELVTQARSGPAAARNAGVAPAQGELVAFTDDDCRPRPDWLRRLADRFVASPTEAIGGRTVNALPQNPYSTAAQLVIDVGYRQNNEGPTGRRWFTTNNLAVPVDGLREIGGFDPAFRTAEDRDFCSRWVERGFPMSYEPRAVVEHAHDLSLAGFVRLHFAYGRGAFRYHRAQRRRRRPVPIEPSFYVALAQAPIAHDRGTRRLGLEALLVLWHLSNSAGFVWGWARSLGKSRPAGRP